MNEKIIDFRSKKRAKEISAVIISENSFDDLEKVFYINGYLFTFINIIDNKNDKDKITEVVFTVRRKTKTFDALLERWKNNEKIKTIYLSNAFKKIKKNNN